MFIGACFLVSFVIVFPSQQMLFRVITQHKEGWRDDKS